MTEKIPFDRTRPNGDKRLPAANAVGSPTLLEVDSSWRVVFSPLSLHAITGWFRSYLMRLREIAPGPKNGLSRHFSHRSVKGWDRGLCEFISMLDLVNRSMEEEFLQIGSKLEVTYCRSREMAKMASEIMETMSGGEIGEAAEELRRQAAQLRHSADDLVGAVKSIIDNLGPTIQSISGISDEARRIAGTGGGEETSYFSRIEQGLTYIRSAHSEYDKVSSEFRRLMTSVASMTEGLSVTVKWRRPQAGSFPD